MGDDAGQPFIAMEYVEGESLRPRIDRQPLCPDEAAALVSQVAAGLEEASHKGIVHRDIKSANIMVTPQGRAKVMDFGLAKLQGGPALTRTGTTLGTVAYMSPEQASGDEVDHRSDVWSAGVVLYEMLTGALPFQGERDLAVIHVILHENPRPMPSRTPPIPEALQHVVAKALKKKPEARYASAGAMLADLGAYEDARRAEAVRGFSVRALARQLRRPRVAIPAVVAIAALAVGASWFIRHRADMRWAREVALSEIERMVGENDAWRNLVPPYRLAVRAESILGNDPKLAELLSKVSLNIDIRTEPPGARAFMTEYGTPDAEWTDLGVTPIENVRVPIGIFRWKLEKEGYETVLAAASTWNIGRPEDKVGVPSPAHLVRTLDKAGSAPAGMVRVPATDTPAGPLDVAGRELPRGASGLPGIGGELVRSGGLRRVRQDEPADFHALERRQRGLDAHGSSPPARRVRRPGPFQQLRQSRTRCGRKLAGRHGVRGLRHGGQREGVVLERGAGGAGGAGRVLGRQHLRVQQPEAGARHGPICQKRVPPGVLPPT